ncbi:MAG: hypothetical protein JWR11_4972 [Mycobacterium sp.]|jgi:hypothetical protein|nr:hypothetical protein [Mycobacterium sp.]MDT5178908.1 hypothetical protein [Mycobacterium sp.]
MNDVDRRRLMAGFFLLAAPALIALGALGLAGEGRADASSANNGPSISAPVHHDAFPQQHNTPQPGTSVHHQHQRNR